MNRRLEAAVGPSKGGQLGWLGYRAWVAVVRRARRGQPDAPYKPTEWTWDAETRQWLRPSESVQSEHPLIREAAAELAREATSVGHLGELIGEFLRRRVRPGLARSRRHDALTCLQEGGTCLAVPKLAAALFRAAGVPARLLAVEMPYAQRTEIHGLVEMAVFGAGWMRFWNLLFPYRVDEEVVMKVGDHSDEFDPPRYVFCYARPFWDETGVVNAGQLANRTERLAQWATDDALAEQVLAQCALRWMTIQQNGLDEESTVRAIRGCCRASSARAFADRLGAVVAVQG